MTIRLYAYPAIQLSGFRLPAIRLSSYPAIRLSGYLAILADVPLTAIRLSSYPAI